MFLKTVEIEGMFFVVKMPDGCGGCQYVNEGLSILRNKKFYSERYGLGAVVVRCGTEPINGGRRIDIEGLVNGREFRTEKDIEVCTPEPKKAARS